MYFLADFTCFLSKKAPDAFRYTLLMLLGMVVALLAFIAVNTGVYHFTGSAASPGGPAPVSTKNHTWNMVRNIEPVDDTPGGRLATVLKPYVTTNRTDDLSSLKFSYDHFGDINKYFGSTVITKQYSTSTADSFDLDFVAQVRQARNGQTETLYEPSKPPVPPTPATDPINIANNRWLTTIYCLAMLLICWLWAMYNTPKEKIAPARTDIIGAIIVAAISLAVSLGTSPELAVAVVVPSLVCVAIILLVFKSVAKHRRPQVIRELEALQRVLIAQIPTHESNALLDRIEKAIAVAKELPQHEAREISITVAYELEPIVARIEAEIREKFEVITAVHQEQRKLDRPELILHDAIPAQYQG